MKEFIQLIICLTLLIHPLFSHAKTLHHRSLDTPFLRLGDGYLSYDKLSVGESPLNLEKTKIFYSDIQSAVNLNQTTDYENLAKNLNIDFSLSGGWGNFSANALIDYLKYLRNTDYAENFSFTERYYVNSLLDINELPADLTSFNNVASTLYTKKGIQAFTNRYGDHFITQLPMGAFLIANLKFNFSSALDKQKFDTNLGGNFGSLFNAKLTIENAIAHSNIQGTIDVSAYQLGGDPAELPKIFEKQADKGYYITSCDLDNWKNCQAAIDSIIAYAQNNFSQQIKSNGLGVKPAGNLAVVGAPVLATYATKFGISSAPTLDSAILDARMTLINTYNDLKTNKTFFDHFIASPASAYFTPNAFNLLKELQNNLNWNFSLFDQFGAIRCYLPGEEQECSSILAQIQQFSKPLSEETISFYRNSGFFEDHAQCNYVPVGMPRDENPFYANFCLGQWVKGIFSFKINPDIQKLKVTGQYVSLKTGHEITVTSTLSPRGSMQNFTGLALYHDLNTDAFREGPLAVRMTKNNV